VFIAGQSALVCSPSQSWKRPGTIQERYPRIVAKRRIRRRSNRKERVMNIQDLHVSPAARDADAPESGPDAPISASPVHGGQAPGSAAGLAGVDGIVDAGEAEYASWFKSPGEGA